MGDEIIKVLDALCDKFGIAIDWTSQNVMPYLINLGDRLIKYEILTSIFAITVWGLLFFGMCKLTAYINKTSSYDAELCGMVTLAIGVVAVFVLLMNVSDIITALTIPEKIIFIELQHLM